MKQETLSEAYSPARFEREGHQLIDMLAHYLETSIQGTEPLNRWIDPAEQYDYWSRELETEDNDLHQLFEKYMSHSLKLHHRNYMGHQVAVPAPDAVLASLLTDMLNNVAVVYEMGPAAVAMERAVIKRVARRFGFDDQADGFMTSGGSLANLTAMLAIRSIKGRDDVWSHGIKGVQYAVMASDEAHYSIEKALRVMGFGSEGCIKVPAGDDYTMRTDLLPELLAKARAEGKEVLGVVGSACSTSMGIYENLNAIADFCQKENLWFHVDAAHGGPAIFSDRYRHLLSGIERADSITMDFHKMMMTPALATAVIFRHGGDSYKTFAQKAQYLWEEPSEPEWYNLGQRSYECSKLMMGTRVYTLFKCYGDRLFGEYVDRTYDMARQFAALIEAHPHMELALQPQTNVVCYRYRPDFALSEEELSELNARIRHEMLEKADFYTLQTRLHGRVWLRITVMNPFTDSDDFGRMIDQTVTIGDRLSDELRRK